MQLKRSLYNSVARNVMRVDSESVQGAKKELEMFTAKEFKRLAQMNLSIPVKLFHL